MVYKKIVPLYLDKFNKNFKIKIKFMQYTIHFINECDLFIHKIQEKYQTMNKAINDIVPFLIDDTCKSNLNTPTKTAINQSPHIQQTSSRKTKNSLKTPIETIEIESKQIKSNKQEKRISLASKELYADIIIEPINSISNTTPKKNNINLFELVLNQQLSACLNQSKPRLKYLRTTTKGGIQPSDDSFNSLSLLSSDQSSLISSVFGSDSEDQYNDDKTLDLNSFKTKNYDCPEEVLKLEKKISSHNDSKSWVIENNDIEGENGNILMLIDDCHKRELKVLIERFDLEKTVSKNNGLKMPQYIIDMMNCDPIKPSPAKSHIETTEYLYFCLIKFF
jgi:hypothetical protein